MFDGLLHEIEKAKSICVFRHQIPDPDALGSQWGLIEWIKETYPSKKVYGCGYHVGGKPDLFPAPDQVSDEIISLSLVIVVDTANQKRIDDPRFSLAKSVIKIDHHPNFESYGTREYVFDDKAATCEIIASFLQEVVSKPLSKKVATYLYMGLLTDTLNFTTNNTSASTLQIAAYLAQSNLNFSELSQKLFSISSKEFQFSNYIRSNALIKECGLAYIVISKELLERFEITPNQAKERITDFQMVNDFDVWALFIEQIDGIKPYFNGSLRSKKIVINDIAQLFNGGGHRQAAAVKGLSFEQIDQVVDHCCKRLMEVKSNESI